MQEPPARMLAGGCYSQLSRLFIYDHSIMRDQGTAATEAIGLEVGPLLLQFLSVQLMLLVVSAGLNSCI